MLELKNVNAWHGAIQALYSVNLYVDKEEIVSIIGANGAGKSTILMTICGIVSKKDGEIFFEEEPIHQCLSDHIVKKGISQVPEGRRIFSNLSVKENLELGAFLRRDKKDITKDINLIFEIFPVLQKRMHQRGGTLSGGEQQMLAISRALMARPKLLLLDEPSLGLAPLIIKNIFDILKKINKENGTTILLVEQNANQALKISNRAYVLETGNIILSGNSDSILSNEKVREAYLGI